MKHRLFFCLLAFSLVILDFQLNVRAALAESDAVYVSVRESKLRGKPDFFSPGSADVKYGDRLSLLSKDGAWLTVKTAGGKQGFIHQSAITGRKVVLKSSAQFDAGQADQNDVVLAGKGFSAQVERDFANAHRDLNFADVNSMERIKVAPKDLASFVAQGQLGARSK